MTSSMEQDNGGSCLCMKSQALYIYNVIGLSFVCLQPVHKMHTTLYLYMYCTVVNVVTILLFIIFVINSLCESEDPIGNNQTPGHILFSKVYISHNVHCNRCTLICTCTVLVCPAVLLMV